MDSNIELSKKLEAKGRLTFRGPDKKIHHAVVSNGLVIIDKDIIGKTKTLTWDTFTYLYLTGLPYSE